jgi:hypothetical protein
LSKQIPLVVRVDQDKLVIPAFQRGFKWQTPDIRNFSNSSFSTFLSGQHCSGAHSEECLNFGALKRLSFQMKSRNVRTIVMPSVSRDVPQSGLWQMTTSP